MIKLRKTDLGFTLIEVLLALAIIAIALTALLKATAQNVENTGRIKEITISHWVAEQAVNMIQLGLFQPNPGQESTQTTNLLGQKWYWRASLQSTPVKKVQKIVISVSQDQIGPFREALTAFRFTA